MSKEKIGIGVAGFGRIGSTSLFITEKKSRLGGERQGWTHEDGYVPSFIENIQVDAIITRGENYKIQSLVEFDSKYPGLKILDSVTIKEGALNINGREVLFEKHEFNSSDKKQQINWSEAGAQIVVDATGVNRSRERSQTHLDNGAELVIISAPGEKGINPYVNGVNNENYSPEERIISAGSCTTNCVAPVARVIHEEFGIVTAGINITHSYTGSQNLTDGTHEKEITRGRSAVNGGIIPTSTGAAKALRGVLPEIYDPSGKNIAITCDRIDTDKVSMAAFSFTTKNPVTENKVVDTLRRWSQPGSPLHEVIVLMDEKRVSVDFNGAPYTAIIRTDDGSIRALNENTFQIKAYFDTETGYTANLLRLASDIVNRM